MEYQPNMASQALPQERTDEPPVTRAHRPALGTVEAFSVAAVALGYLGVAIYAQVHGIQIDWLSFTPSLLPWFLLLLCGLYARRAGWPRMAMFSINLGLVMGFVGMGMLYTYLPFPISGPTLDPLLIEIDAGLGFHWPSFTEAMSRTGILWPTLWWVYNSSLVQILTVIGVLSLMRRGGTISRFVITSAVSLALTTIAFWIWPSFGAAAELGGLFPAEAPAGVFTGIEFAESMRQLAAHGRDVIRLPELTGIVAMPSYHTVMACLCVWFAWGTPLRWVFVVLNIFMIPAILSHGGHHLVDVPGGLLAFAAALWMAHRLVSSAEDA